MKRKLIILSILALALLISSYVTRPLLANAAPLHDEVCIHARWMDWVHDGNGVHHFAGFRTRTPRNGWEVKSVPNIVQTASQITGKQPNIEVHDGGKVLKLFFSWPTTYPPVKKLNPYDFVICSK